VLGNAFIVGLKMNFVIPFNLQNFLGLIAHLHLTSQAHRAFCRERMARYILVIVNAFRHHATEHWPIASVAEKYGHVNVRVRKMYGSHIGADYMPMAGSA
jgi:hypothetical protein